MPKKRILIADDSKTATMMVQMILKRWSYETITAVNGREAVEKARLHQPDLILMDVVMPELGGFEAVAAIRKDVSRDVPIIMVTTHGEPVNVERGYACGCNDYTTKPVDALELMAKIEHLLGQHGEVAHGP